jgi:hypothetical protein
MDSVPLLCRRYGADAETVCLRMVETDLETCALARLEARKTGKAPRRPLSASGRGETRGQTFAVAYAVPTRGFRRAGLSLPGQLTVPRAGCLCEASRARRTTAGHQRVLLDGVGEALFRIEALPLTASRSRHGRAPVLAFFYPA